MTNSTAASTRWLAAFRALLAPLEQASRDQAGALQTLTLASLAAQKERLAGYGTQARFAMAQLHDRARQPLPEAANDAAR